MHDAPDNAVSEPCSTTPPRDWRNAKRALWALLFWAISFVTLSQLVKRGVLEAGPLAWSLATVPMAAGLLVFVAYGRYLKEADELHRLIHLQALALGFGGVFVIAASYRLFARLGAPALDADHLIVMMTVLYSFGCVVGQWRYR